ncbi:MAG: hypothetical protein ABIR36_17235 [Nitrospiraceae bacterium]
MTPVEPLVLAQLLGLKQIDWLPQLGCSSVWARNLARDPRHSRKVRIAILKAALERDSFDEAIAGGLR